MLTAAVALGVAALALLSPLERRLREQEVRDLVAQATQSRSAFTDLDLTDLRPGSARLQRLIRRVARQTGARIALLGPPGRAIVDTDPDEHDGFKDYAAALATSRAVRRVVPDGTAGEARVAVRVEIAGRDYVLALRKPLDEQRAAVLTVRRAFLTAAIAALAVSFLVAAGFAATIVRRLHRLRDAMHAFGRSGARSELPEEAGTDEVADLSRAFAELGERLAGQEELRRAFVATASHELRTPLTSLQGQLELLEEDLTGPAPDLEDARRQLAGARVQSDRLARLASDLLDLSRLDARLEMRREPVAVAELSRAVAAEFEARASRRGTRIELDAPVDLRADADPGAVARVLRILLDNALRHSPADAAVQVDVRALGAAVEIGVADHGPGIPLADRERIFDRFARGADAGEQGGFGLGLAIGRELSERMGGSLVLDHGDGGMTRFALRLPAAEAVAEAGQANAIPT
jgi:signal transduction histidine kinase